MTLQEPLKTDFLIEESFFDYHRKRPDFMSSHQLGDFIESPTLWKQKNTEGVKDHDTKALKFGRAAHTLILEGESVFRKDYIDPADCPEVINEKNGKPWAPTTKKYKAWSDTIVDKAIMNADDTALAYRLRDAVANHELASELLKDGVGEGVVRGKIEGVPVQIRPDWVNPNYGMVDLKTTLNMRFFEYDSKKYRYQNQLAFYRKPLEDEMKIDFRLPCYLVAVEKKAPYRVGVWLYGEEFLAQAEQENAEALIRWKECKQSDTWNTGYEKLRHLVCL